MKRIGIDARLYFQTGVGVYIRNLLHYLEVMNTKDLELYVYVMKNESPRISFKQPNFKKREVTAKWHTFAEQISFLIDLNKDKLDLMHFTYFSHPVLYNRPFIATIHDTILLDHKTGTASTLLSPIYNIKHFAFRFAFNHQLQKSKVVIAPSETVKTQIIDMYGQQYTDKIIALHEGVDYEKMSKKENSDLKIKFKKPFLLYVGNFYPHKNVERLIQAFSDIKEDVQLVLVGPNDYFFVRIENLVKQLHQEDRVVLYPNASDEDLIYFYKHTKALVHPSLSEGFGLPVIEAKYFDTTVIASDIPVFKEILGPDSTGFDPKDVDDIRQKIEDCLSRNNKHSDYKLSLSDFSFEKMTREILKLYMS